MHFQSYQILNSNKKTLSFSRNICYNAQVKFNRILTNISNPEERAKEELWGWNPKASAPAGTFKGSVKSLKNKQRPTVVRRRSQEKVIAAGNKIAAVRRQAGRRSIARRIIRMACFGNKETLFG